MDKPRPIRAAVLAALSSDWVTVSDISNGHDRAAVRTALAHLAVEGLASRQVRWDDGTLFEMWRARRAAAGEVAS